MWLELDLIIGSKVEEFDPSSKSTQENNERGGFPIPLFAAFNTFERFRNRVNQRSSPPTDKDYNAGRRCDFGNLSRLEPGWVDERRDGVAGTTGVDRELAVDGVFSRPICTSVAGGSAKATRSGIEKSSRCNCHARTYMVAKNSEKEKGVPCHDFDGRWDAMIPVLEGHIPAWVVANEITQLQPAIVWAEQEHLKLALLGVEIPVALPVS